MIRESNMQENNSISDGSSTITFSEVPTNEFDLVTAGVFMLFGVIGYKIIASKIEYETLNPIVMIVTFLSMGYLLVQMFIQENTGLSAIPAYFFIIIGFIIPHLNKRAKLKR